MDEQRVVLRPISFLEYRTAPPLGEQRDRLDRPVVKATANLCDLYHRCSSSFKYTPRRCLTAPSEPFGNDGHDNVNSDYILFVNDVLGSAEGRKYRVLDLLGIGTFGQVVKCQREEDRSIYAVKIIKNKTAYYNQALTEIRILRHLSQSQNVDEVAIVKMVDFFIHNNHLCICTEQLTLNLYELIKQNQYRGLSLKLISYFFSQIMRCMSCLQDNRVIHCDLKPENIMLMDISSPKVKIIDFGSACFEHEAIYSYIQSRFYRSPEVLLGVPYGPAMDMWSLGCIAAELFLGLPLFPGISEMDMLVKIESMRGKLPHHLLEAGTRTRSYYHVLPTSDGVKYDLKSPVQYRLEHPDTPEAHSKYFNYDTISELVLNYPLRRGMCVDDVEKEKERRRCFVDFLCGLLQVDPHIRWTPYQAILHPFITGVPFVTPFTPPPHLGRLPFTRTAPIGIKYLPASVALGTSPSAMSPAFDYTASPVSRPGNPFESRPPVVPHRGPYTTHPHPALPHTTHPTLPHTPIKRERRFHTS